jgi:hypothetical protein
MEGWSAGVMPEMTNDEGMVKVAGSALRYGAASECGFDSWCLELLWGLEFGALARSPHF